MTDAVSRAAAGWQLFASYAYPPNELGYCGPPDSSVLLARHGPAEIAAHARGFDGAWPYLEEIAAAAGIADPLDADVVCGYWLGVELSHVDGERLVTRLREALAGQPTGLLDHAELPRHARADHSFHVFAVYPWVRFLGRTDNATPLRILQSCRIRWGTVESVDDERLVIVSRPLVCHDGALALGDELPESVRWARDGRSLTSRPAPGQTVSVHWDWACGVLDAQQAAALSRATAASLNLVNRLACAR